MPVAFIEIIELLKDYVILGFALHMGLLLSLFYIGRISSTEVFLYGGCFVIGVALLNFVGITSLQEKETYSHCVSLNEYVVNCNGWLTFNKTVSSLALSFGEWRKYLTGTLSLPFCAAVICFILYAELGKNIFATHNELLSVFLMTGFVILAITNSGFILSGFNALIEGVLPFGPNPDAVYNQAATKVASYYQFFEEIEKRNLLLTAIESIAGLNAYTAGAIRSVISVILLGLVSFSNLILMAIQELLIAFLPLLILFSYLVGTFEPTKPISYLFYASLLKGSTVFQLYFLENLPALDSTGFALSDATFSIVHFISYLLLFFAIQSIAGFKLILLIMAKEIIPTSRGVGFIKVRGA